ncbi:hypothetical protein B4U79_04438 [Dinothrombium tinctorium]|uniref:Deoxyhypusine hydroxylase n=1 Tax=Dinothrombium tinctorium TaxID=1965070 RepID=A0A3S3P4N8_9ACAR|nr:hypothetical protein B4U79_05752 [Dinothrombium tinctorium]RWS11655.1 hypothetical protein B4U79_12086 [Dinothrombium tinctorium]RWS12046.1 hypothetical protein B4U79_12107 [Dinothrombium tinctorium]RWS12942.1 hypothetical protein B4U79_04438 [Dinothrombium tinctorium]
MKIEEIGFILTNRDECLAKRFRALFALRNAKGKQAIDYITQTLREDSSALLKHECCFCLGQMQDEYAIECLIRVLEDKREHPMVRHEAGEALGAIATEECLRVLRKYCDDECVEVAQTCQLAVKRIHSLREGEHFMQSVYNSVDPTPTAPETDIDALRQTLFAKESCLYDKYRTMFALRNLATEEAIKSLGEALVFYQDDQNNALLKHEIAYVLGQIQSPHSVSYLQKVLSDFNENEMVRHECAEALGSVASDESQQILNNFKNDEVTVVRESIEVALDMDEYEKSADQFLFLNSSQEARC